MKINSINASQVKFAGEESQKPKGRGGKAVASAFIPGLGQFCDGRTKEGVGFLAGSIGLGVLSKLVSKPVKSTVDYAEQLSRITNFDLNSVDFDEKNIIQTAEQMLEAVNLEVPKSKLILPVIIGLASLGLWVVNIVDAFKGGINKKTPVETAEMPVEPTEASDEIDEAPIETEQSAEISEAK